MNKAPITDAVIKQWKEKAGDRKTVVFCSTIDHAMVGRGLRTVDPNEHPGVTKSDCIVLDFGISTL